MDQAVEAYAAREFHRAIEVCDAILKKDPDHARAHSFKALSNLESAVRSLRGHFDALSLAAVALRGSEQLPEAESKRHLKTAKRTFKSLSKQVEAFLGSLSHALKKDPSLHRDFPPQTAEDYRHHWQEGLSKALRAACDVIVKIEPQQEEKLNARLEELAERFEGLLNRIETPPNSLPDADYGEITGEGELFGGLAGDDDGEEGFPRFDLGEMHTMSLADDEGKLELMSLAENTEAGQMLVTDASGMIVEFDDTAGPIGRLEFPGAPAEDEPDPEEEQRKLAEMERERQAQLEAMQQMASQAANQAAEQMQKQLEEARKQADEERKRFEASLAEAQQALSAAEQRLQSQAQEEEQRRKKDVAKAQDQAAEEARRKLKELERENEEAKRRLAEAEEERKKAAQAAPEEVAAQVAERVAMQMIERFQEQMQHKPEEMPSAPTPQEVAQEVAQILGPQMAAGGGNRKADKQVAKIAASAAEQASREIHEQVTMLTGTSMTGLTTGTTAAKSATASAPATTRRAAKPDLPSLDGGINKALGRKRGGSGATGATGTGPATGEKGKSKKKTKGKSKPPGSTEGKATERKDKSTGTGAPKGRSRKAPSPETLLGVKQATKRTGVAKHSPHPQQNTLSFQDREEVVPLETPEGKGLIKELSAAYRDWVQNLKGHPWPQAAEALFPMSLHRGRLYTFQLQVIFETRILKPGEAEYEREMLPQTPLSAREIDLWSLGVDLPLKAVSQHAVYRLPESYERKGNRLNFLELRVERAPRVEMFLYPADSLPSKANLVEALRGATVLATEQFEPFLDPPATRRLFPKALHPLVRNLASDLQRQETTTTKLRSLTVVVAEVPMTRMRYRLPGAPDYLSGLPAQTPKVASLTEITNEDPQLGRIYECCYFAQPGETKNQRTWHVAPRADVALEHAASLHSDAVWSATRGQQNRTMRLTQQLLKLDPSDAEAAALQRKVRRQARTDYRVGFLLGMLLVFLLALFALQATPAVTLALAPLYLLAGASTSFALWHSVGVLLGSRWLRWILGSAFVAGVKLAAPWVLAKAAPYPWLEFTDLYPALLQALET